jgi:serine/threonine protein phosphatase PrpC
MLKPRGRPSAAPPSNATPSLLVGNAHHIGGRDSQQDCFGISDASDAALHSPKGVFAMVADGMGGLSDGSEISALAVRTMLQYFTEFDACGKPELDLLNMLYAANDNVNRYLVGRAKGGSTAVAVIIAGGSLYWISVGDSRIYLVRGGAIMQITREHVYAVDLDERAATGEITWEQAANDPQRAALTNYLGMGKLEKVDRNIRPLRLQRGDRVLLMSDGVFGTVSDDEILAAMSAPPAQAAEALRDAVLGKQTPHQDNLTAVILEYR